jgi:DNA-directed RNA polymerase subunit RPC12/RpoP
MKVTYQLGKLTASFECDTQKDLFTQLSSFQEVFGQSKCGKCGAEDLVFIVRENGGNEYHEMRCTSCNARLSFGVNKKGGGLFPKRKDAEGNWLPDGGWVKWNQKTQAVE